MSEAWPIYFDTDEVFLRSPKHWSTGFLHQYSGPMGDIYECYAGQGETWEMDTARVTAPSVTTWA